MGQPSLRELLKVSMSDLWHTKITKVLGSYIKAKFSPKCPVDIKKNYPIHFSFHLKRSYCKEFSGT